MNIFQNKRLILIGGLCAIVIIAGLVGYSALSNQASAGNSTLASTATIDNGNEDDIDWDSLPTTDVALTNQSYAITAAGTYVFSGSSTAGISVDTDGDVRIILNGVTIKSTTGAAIAITSANNTVIQLADGTSNVVADASTRSDESIDGAIYSADDLIFTGSGSLTVTANFADAIVSNDDLTFSSGTYTITSVDDGIRGKDSVNITDGTYTIDAAGDAIKSTNDAEAGKGTVQILAGTFTIKAGDDAIHAEEAVVIKGGTIDISTSTEGIEGATVTIDSGTINLYASDDGINAPGSTFTDAAITFNGGNITVEVGQGDTDAIDSNGDVTVTGGTITVTAPTSSFDYDGTATMTGGTIIVNGETLSDIPDPMMMGGGMGGGGMRR